MAVEDLVGHGAQGLHHQGANGDVGHEAAVHNVHVHPFAASLVNCAHLYASNAMLCVCCACNVGMGSKSQRNFTSSPSLLKSAERMEGDTMMSFLLYLSTRDVAATRTARRAAGRLARTAFWES
jgi:hypothetical protein